MARESSERLLKVPCPYCQRRVKLTGSGLEQHIEITHKPSRIGGYKPQPA